MTAVWIAIVVALAGAATATHIHFRSHNKPAATRSCMYGQCATPAVWIGQPASNAPDESYISFACNDHRFGLMYLRPYDGDR